MSRTKFRSFAAVAALAFAFAVAGPAPLRAAQAAVAGSAEVQAPPSDEATTPDASAPTFHVTTEVTATAVAEERRDVPATVRVVEGTEVAARHDESVLDLLATVPGAQAATYGPPGQLGSLFVRGADSNQTLVLWNGVPLNDPFSDEYNFAFLATDAVTRVEVVPGPFSALFGSSAMGGVVQVITGRRRGGAVDLEAGERDRRRVALSLGGDHGPLHGELAGHYREGDGGLGNDHYDGRELSGKLEWTASPSTDASLLLRWNDSDTGIPFVGFTPSPQRSIAWTEHEWALPVSHTGAQWDASGMASQVRYQNDFRDPEDPFGFTEGSTDSRADRARAQASRRFDWGWWAFGGEWERVRVTDDGSFGTNLDDATQRTDAAFTELHLERGRFAADLGVRRDENDGYGGATSPRLGVVFAATSTLRVRASYGESFRAPALVELYYPFSGNPDLEPERGATAEVGLAWQRDAWSLDLAAFESRQHDLITYDFAANHNVNVGRARSRGVDGEVRWRGAIVEMRLGGMRLDAEDRDTGDPLKNRPRANAQLVAIARPGRLELSLVGSWVGERVNAFPEFPYGDTGNPAYATVDLTGGWRLGHGVVPYARVENALDREYQPVLGFPASGRTVVVGARVEW